MTNINRANKTKTQLSNPNIGILSLNLMLIQTLKTCFLMRCSHSFTPCLRVCAQPTIRGHKMYHKMSQVCCWMTFGHLMPPWPPKKCRKYVRYYGAFMQVGIPACSFSFPKLQKGSLIIDVTTDSWKMKNTSSPLWYIWQHPLKPAVEMSVSVQFFISIP